MRGRVGQYGDVGKEGTAASMEASESKTGLTETPERPVRRSARRERRRWPRVGALVAIAAVLGIGIWYALDSQDNGSSDATVEQEAGTPVALSPNGLRTLATAMGQPIYWLGPRADTTYEVMQTSNGRVYVRYLPDGTKVGDSGTFLTVGTYAVPNAYGVLESGTRESGASAIKVAGGGIGLARARNPSDVYVAYPGSDYQIEVYSPNPKEARGLVESGQLKAVGGVPAGGTTAGAAGVSADRLKALATSLGQPIYWAGTRPQTTYEFTRVDNGSVYVRYLPTGVPVGSSEAYLTVSTYPVKKALKVTKAAAAQPGAVKLVIGGGGIGVYNPTKPMNVYVAFPGSEYQIEVFDPKAGEARKLVAAERIAPVR